MSEALSPEVAALLSQDAAGVHRPPPMPPGSYRTLIHGFQWTKSSKKGTPGVQFDFKGFEPGSDVDGDAWQAYLADPGCNVKGKTMSTTFWLTKDALWRLTEFFEHCGLEKSGPVGKLVEQCKGQTVVIKVSQSVSQDGQTVYNDITGTEPQA